MRYHPAPLSRPFAAPSTESQMIRHSGLLRLLLVLIVLAAASGCSRFNLFNRDSPLETLPVEQMYAEGNEAVRNGNFSRAARFHRRLISRFPYGPYTEQAQLELAYAQYKGNDPEEALSTLNRFTKTYPTHPHIDYAYYLRALVNFQREATVLDRLARIDQTQRDQASVRTSFNDFAELIRRYPNSRYALDARQRMVYLRNQMARHEMNVARYYLRREAYVAAAKRSQFLIENFPQAEQVPDALAVMSESYARLGQEELAADARRVLEANAPEHPYLRGEWPQRRSLWRRLIPLGGNEGDG